MEEVKPVMMEFLGKGVFLSLGLFLLIYSVNFMYISARGIKKLDAYFEDGKDYNDTWSLAATSRFCDYCYNFMRGRLKVSDHDMRWWMYYNAVGYILTTGYIAMGLLIYCYLKICSWLS